MAITYLRLFPATQQFELRNGHLDVAGQLKVFYEGTDDLAGVYDVDGSQLPQPVILDDNGRAQGLFVDSARVYRLEVYDRYGELLYTVRKMVPSGGGAGSALGNTYEIVSSDGSIEINSTEEGSKTTYDIGIAPGNSDEFLEWCKCTDTGVIDGPLYPTMSDGTMESAGGQGLHVGKDRFYHITSSFKVYPKGDGINYETLVAKLMFNDGEDHQVTVRGFDIDNSVHDPVLCEFSYDFKAPEDGYLFLDIDGASAFTMVDCELQVHRIYSGINAVPDTCATKQFVSDNYQPLSDMSSYVAYSAISGNTASQITGIGGSAIAGSLDSATVSSIASSVASAYTESAFSSISAWSADISSISAKMDISGMTAYATTAFVESSLSGKLDASASSMFITALPADMATTGDIASAVSGKLDNSASSTWYPMTGNPSGFLTAVPTGYATTGDVASAVSGKLDTSAYSSESGNFVQNSSFTSYTSNVNTTINNISSSVTTMSSDVSGKVDQSAMSSWIPYSALDYSGTAISGIGGSSLAGMGGGGADYTGIYPINVDNTAREIAVDSFPLVTDSSMTSYASGDSSVIGVAPGVFFSSLPVSASAGNDSAVYGIQSAKLRSQYDGVDVMPNSVRLWHNGFSASVDYDAINTWNSAVDTVSTNSASWGALDSATVSAIASGYVTGKQDVSGMSAYAYESSNSAKLDKTAQVVTATSTQLYAGTAYLTGVNGAPVSASRAGNAANASLANSAYYDGTGRLISSLPDSATVSAIASSYATGKQDASAMSAYVPFSAISADENSAITSINGSSIGGGGITGDYVEKSATVVTIGSNVSAVGTSFVQGSKNTATYFSLVQGLENSGNDNQTMLQGYQNRGSGANVFAQGTKNSAFGNGFAQGDLNKAEGSSLAQGTRCSALSYSFAQGYLNSASGQSFAQGYASTAYNKSFAQGLGIVAKNTAAALGTYNISSDGDVSTGNSAAFAIGDGTAVNARHNLMLVTKDGEITMYSSTADTVGTGIMSSIRAISAAATGGGIDSATCSAIASSYAASKQDSSAMSAYVPFSVISADENSAITSINGSSIGGGTQVVTATGSANLNGTAINTINGSAIIAKSLSAVSLLVGSSDPGMYLTGGSNGGTAYYKSNELVINRSGYGETIKFNLGSAGSQIYGSAAGTRGAFMQMSNDNHTAFFGAASGKEAKIELDGYSAGSANMAGWDSTWNTVTNNSATWGAKPETAETPAGFWNGSAIYQKIVSATMAIGTAVTTTNIATPTSDNAWIDQANSYIIHNGFSWGTNWYLSSNRFMACWLNGTAGSISWRGADAALTGKTATAYITIKYTK